MKVLLIVVLVGVILLIGVYIGTYITLSRYPQCQEQIVLAGQGQFKNGRWDYYVCGPSFDDWEG